MGLPDGPNSGGYRCTPADSSVVDGVFAIQRQVQERFCSYHGHGHDPRSSRGHPSKPAAARGGASGHGALPQSVRRGARAPALNAVGAPVQGASPGYWNEQSCRSVQ